MSVEINVASFTDSSVIQLAGDYLADYGGIFITAGGKARFKYKQNDNFFENEVDITLNTWHRVEQFRVKLVDKVLRKLKAFIYPPIFFFQHINEVRVDGKVYSTKVDPNPISTGEDIRIEVAGSTPFDGKIRNFYYDMNIGLPYTTEFLGELINPQD